MLGQSSPIDPTVKFTDQLKALTARVAELERAANVDRSPRILLTRATGQTIDNAGSGEQIDWSTAETYVSQVGGDFKASSADSITIPSGLSGDYRVTLSGQFDTNSTGVRQLWVVIGSNTATGELANMFSTVPAHASLPGRLVVSNVVRLDDGATLAAWAFQNSGAGLILSNMRFSAVRIGG